RSHDLQKTGGSPDIARRSRKRARLFFIAFISFLIMCVWLTHKAAVVSVQADQVAAQKPPEKSNVPTTSVVASPVSQPPVSGAIPAPPVIIGVPANQPAAPVTSP